MVRNYGSRLLALALAPVLLQAGEPSKRSWDQLQTLTRADKVRVYVTGKEMPQTGQFECWEPESIAIRKKGGEVVQIGRSQVDIVTAMRKGSRTKGALVGAAVGFGGGFAIGAGSAGQVMDINNPTGKDRAQGGAIFGAVFGGIGAGIGAAVSGTRQEVVYRAR